MLNAYRNQILDKLNAADLALLEPHLTTCALKVRAVLEGPGETISHVYFPESGVASVVASMPPARDIEVGIIGRDGMIGGSVLLHDPLAAHKTYMQIAGTAYRLPVAALVCAAGESASLRSLLLRYLRAFGLQVAGTALANGHSSLEARLARWLLMCTDRLDSATLELTHEFLSVMIGVRRSGVTLALQVLEGEHAIRASRGSITVLNRALLEERAGGAYGPPEAEYSRLVGHWTAPPLIPLETV